jgi:hypothetical protein
MVIGQGTSYPKNGSRLHNLVVKRGRLGHRKAELAAELRWRQWNEAVSLSFFFNDHF